MLQRGVDAHHLRIRFRVHQAREPVTRIAPDTTAAVWIRFVQANTERHVEGTQSLVREVFAQCLNAWLVADRWKRILVRGRRLGRILARLTGHFVQALGGSGVRPEIPVTLWP